jgi:hypothetical protein
MQEVTQLQLEAVEQVRLVNLYEVPQETIQL